MRLAIRASLLHFWINAITGFHFWLGGRGTCARCGVCAGSQQSQRRNGVKRWNASTLLVKRFTVRFGSIDSSVLLTIVHDDCACKLSRRVCSWGTIVNDQVSFRLSDRLSGSNYSCDLPWPSDHPSSATLLNTADGVGIRKHHAAFTGMVSIEQPRADFDYRHISGSYWTISFTLTPRRLLRIAWSKR